MDRRANRLAHRLVAAGAGPERVVAIRLPRTADLVVAVLAVLKSGAAYLPIDPDLPADRAAALVADADPVLVLDDASADGPDTAPEVALHERHPAYLLYTSGSTGTPKGVVVEHRSLANLHANHAATVLAGSGCGSR
ncbi:AMP-binding protein [Actinokineospora soli]|uniref:AMP-binding protein n=1 Tax=Actinokineospora soli TaxID=1048753 RepID=A0ABW2TNX1_9PSEU